MNSINSPAIKAFIHSILVYHNELSLPLDYKKHVGVLSRVQKSDQTALVSHMIPDGTYADVSKKFPTQ